MGGAVGRVGEDDTAFSHRDAGFVFIGIAHWLEPHEERRSSRGSAAWPRPRPYSVGTYVNFLGDEGDQRIRFAYGGAEKYDRLVELKRTWDPQNLFCLNQNIKP